MRAQRSRSGAVISSVNISSVSSSGIYSGGCRRRRSQHLHADLTAADQAAWKLPGGSLRLWLAAGRETCTHMLSQDGERDAGFGSFGPRLEVLTPGKNQRESEFTKSNWSQLRISETDAENS